MGTGFSSAAESATKNNNRPAGHGLEDLPESCVALVLAYLDPPDICRSAGLNQAFRRASSADFVWESKLPETYQILLNKLFTNSELYCSLKKDIYARLCTPIRFHGGTKEVWLDKSSRGGVCVSISWKGLKITGIDDRRNWNHISTDESRFHTVAYLQQIWWLEVEGDLEFEFPAGSYSLFFRLHLGRAPKGQQHGRSIWGGYNNNNISSKVDKVHGWDIKPVRFRLSTANGQQQQQQHAISQQCYLNDELVEGKWVNYHVGDFVVENNNNNVYSTKIKFSMTQIDCTHTKGGLSLDSVFICPSHHSLRHRII